MSKEPQGNDEDGRDDPPPTGASRVDPDRFPTQPTPMVPPAGPPGYGRPTPYPPPYGPTASYGQPPQYAPQYGGQYGAPPYGPPPSGRTGTSKVGLIAIATAIVLLVIAGVVVLVMRLQTTVLDPAAVERDVAAQFEQREGVAIMLNCADTMKVRAGATYTCDGTTADGESVTVTIAITDPATAAYTWSEP